MSKPIALVLLSALCHAAVCAPVTSWTKHVAADGSYSFHYPAGWEVSEDESAVQIRNRGAGEEIVLVALPAPRDRSVADLATDMVAAFREGMPDLEASGWSTTQESAESAVTFSITYTEEGAGFRGEVLALRTGDQAMWVSLTAPVDGYDRERVIGVLSAVLGSLAPGDASTPPPAPEQAPPPVDPRLQANARAFVFVLEFAVGAPLSGAEEKLLIDELLKAWQQLPTDQTARFDAYPGLVSVIRQVDQESLEQMRSDLQEQVREWAAQSDPQDATVRAVRSRLSAAGKVLLEGPVPLTERVATAYCELLSFAELAGRDPEASPGGVKPEDVTAAREQLIAAWPGFTEDERKSITTSPAIWAVFRSVWQYGTQEERAKVREQLARLRAGRTQATQSPAAEAPEGTAPAEGGASGGRTPMTWAAHQTMLQVNQMTFNTWRWSRGYTNTMLGW